MNVLPILTCEGILIQVHRLKPAENGRYYADDLLRALYCKKISVFSVTFHIFFYSRDQFSVE